MCELSPIIFHLTVLISSRIILVDMKPATISPVINTRSCWYDTTMAELIETQQNEVNRFLTGPINNCGFHSWIEVAAVNMSDSKSECPSGFTTFTSPIRSCGRRDSTTRITSTTFSVGHSYYRICGRVTAIQKGSTDGFGPTFNDADPAQYVDGVAISHGASISEGHIWTFAAAVSERIQNLYNYNSCPCAL